METEAGERASVGMASSGASAESAGARGERQAERGGDGKCRRQGREKRARVTQQQSKCPHNRERSKCKDCGGASICEHNRRRSQCKDCRRAKEP